MLTMQWYSDHYVPKLKKIIGDNMHLFEGLDEIVIASYNPMQFEMNILPVIQELFEGHEQ